MLFVKTPVLVMKLFPELIWHFSSMGKAKKNHVYLTFDDGPTPEVTPWVLDCLNEYKAKGTFFCLGRNVEKYPEIFTQILEDGHAVGNHTYSHLKGSKISNAEYFDDIELASHGIDSRLFRPPYGRFRKTQIRQIRKDFSIIMWDVLSQDYDPRISSQKCLENVEANIRPGSIIVFHDSVKARKNLYFALPQILEKYSGTYDFLPIERDPKEALQKMAG
jgi:peptidoglycan/xylan/chitin deacetylase (PgdA/CDA1 family)